MGYRVRKLFADKSELCVLINGETVGLNGPFEKIVPASQKKPATTKKVRAATDKELKQLFEDGNPCIEIFEDEQKQVKKKTVDEDGE